MALRNADRFAVAVRWDVNAGWISVERGGVLVAANLGVTHVELPVGGTPRLCWPPTVRVVDGCAALPPDGVIVATSDA